ncbi:N-acetyllactosaminide beta-1,6-N-acetylglucosaminyl-transferase-like [Diadema antillarum]|uniref:N-acetyllactosaminide beta-1,6-N-acetylglucosaminyl-transferase-like n=1 Tax=Diadema antillarum TaxID=105358 RepID=UPI003A890415
MAQSSFMRKILTVCVFFGVGQLLILLYGTRPKMGNVWESRRADKQMQRSHSDSRKYTSVGSSTQERDQLEKSQLGEPSLQLADRNRIPNLYGNSTLKSRDSEVALSSREVKAALSESYNSVSYEARRATMTETFRFDGTWNSSFVSPKYHKHYDVNCSAIVHGDRRAVEAANRLMKKSAGDSPVPPDDAVRNWTKDCGIFRRERRYPNQPQSMLEEEYPVAYIIVTHKDSAQVERLLRAIYQPQNVYCIHPDAKSSATFRSAIDGIASCFQNVFIASQVEDVQYAGFTRLQADINCMADLLRHPVQWHYVLNLCGQDFPLKTNLEIVRQLQVYSGKNDISGVIPPPYIKGRTRAHHKIINGKVTATRIRKSPPPYNLTIHFGNAYYAAARPFVDYVINNAVAIDLLEWSTDTFSPDEHYWGTLNRAPGVPGGYAHPTWDSNVRFMKWGDIKRHPPCQGKYVRALCVFGVGYLSYMSKVPHLFANKFYYSFDPVVLQCIEDLLDFRTARPDAIDDFVPQFPVVDMVWQLND